MKPLSISQFDRLSREALTLAFHLRDLLDKRCRSIEKRFNVSFEEIDAYECYGEFDGSIDSERVLLILNKLRCASADLEELIENLD